MTERPLNGDEIRALLLEVAEVLPDGEQHSITVVGGAVLALHELRSTTADVDTVRRLPGTVRSAAAVVAKIHGLGPHWLNDAAAAFRPANMDDAARHLLLDHPRLRVFGAPLREVFLMKLYAARTRDYDDLIALWPLCGFESGAEAAAEFTRAFPHAPDDPYLASWIDGIATRSRES